MKNSKSCGPVNASSGALYGLGVIGAAIYFLQNAESIAGAIIGIIYAIFWPAVMVYKALELLEL